MYKAALIISGLLALAALAAPWLVTFGFFMLIIPGLILSLAPTVFIYLAVAGLIHAALPLPPGLLGWIVAALLTAAVGWAVMVPMRMVETARWRAQLKPEVIPAQPLPLAGDVLLDFPAAVHSNQVGPGCDYLCAALLDTPGITGVIIGDGINRRRFLLVPHGAAPDKGLRAVNPEQILYLFDKVDAKRLGKRAGMMRPLAETEALREALKAEWALRLNRRQTLVAEPATDAKPDWAVHATSEDRARPSVRRLEIYDSQGELRLRRSLVQHYIPARFFALGFGGTMENPHFSLARELLSSGGRYAMFDPALELALHAVIARPSVPLDAGASLRDTVVAALDDRGSSAQELLAVRDWLKELRPSSKAADEPLVLRIASDLRVPDVAPLLRNILRDPVPLAFRKPFVQRIVDPRTSADDRLYFALRLAAMPVGTFAHPTDQEREIWNDPRLFADATPFLERLADIGDPGLKRLMTLLRQAVQIDSWAKRRPYVREIRRGFARMGPAAAPAIPLVVPLLDQQSSPLVNVMQEYREWYKTLILMGLPPEQVPMPRSFSTEQVARERREAVEAAARYDPDERDGYNY